MGSKMIGRAYLLALLPLFPFFFFQAQPSLPPDTLTSGQSLSGNRTLISRNGVFELGFFKPGESRNYFVGIWYHNNPQTIVWVANRDKYLSNPTVSELRISKDGELVLLDTSKVPVWSTDSKPKPSGAVAAVLLDTGNLVLRNGSATHSDVFWRSFDHPTDTLLPGQPVGFNRSAGQNWFLTSWRNSEDPSAGIFSLQLDPSGISQFFLLRDGTERYWSTGVWDGNTSSFANAPEMRIKTSLSYKNFRTTDANCFMFLQDEGPYLTMMKLDMSGEVKWKQRLKDSQSWIVFDTFPRHPCDVPSVCGPFGACNPEETSSCECLAGFSPRSSSDWSLGDWTGGCRRRTRLQCAGDDSAGGEKDGFLLIPSIQLPINSTALVLVHSAEACERACSEACSCTAYSYSRRCLVWRGDLLNLKKLSSKAQREDGGERGGLYLRLARSEIPALYGGNKVRNAHLPIIVGGSVSALVVLCVALSMIWRYRRRCSTGSNEATQDFLVAFRYKDLKRATKNFSERLGKGGFGSVYKGTLPDSSVVAVKKLDGPGQKDRQFRTEVGAMAAVQHVNIVRLRGFCSEGTKRLLVYDYMPNRSLDCFLLPKSSKALEWSKRYGIALGVARGLAYLHETCRECIIHCDIKPENILLEDDLSPKVSDFGMAKLIGRNFSRVLTTMRGTIGYIAPEWISGVPITPKADVFSFGMMLFEIISGRRNSQASEDGEISFFPDWAARQLSDVGAVSVPETDSMSHTNIEEFRRACMVACWCTQHCEGDRPTMGQVVQMLEGLLDVKVPPVPDHLQGRIEDEEDMVSKLYFHSLPTI